MTPSVDIAASWLVIAGTTAGGWWLARVNRYAKKLGATMAIIVLGLLIANLSGWQPEAGVSSWVNGPLTSLAIVELLLAVELRRVCPQSIHKNLRHPLVDVCSGHRVFSLEQSKRCSCIATANAQLWCECCDRTSHARKALNFVVPWFDSLKSGNFWSAPSSSTKSHTYAIGLFNVQLRFHSDRRRCTERTRHPEQIHSPLFCRVQHLQILQES